MIVFWRPESLKLITRLACLLFEVYFINMFIRRARAYACDCAIQTIHPGNESFQASVDLSFKISVFLKTLRHVVGILLYFWFLWFDVVEVLKKLAIWNITKVGQSVLIHFSKIIALFKICFFLTNFLYLGRRKLSLGIFRPFSFMLNFYLIVSLQDVHCVYRFDSFILHF